MPLPKYEIKPAKGGHVIEKPDGSTVDDHVFKFKWQAERRLEIIKGFGWCK